MTQKVHFRLTSVAQKHRCLSSLIYADFHLATLQFTIFTPFFFQIDFLEWKNVLNVRAMERG